MPTKTPAQIGRVREFQTKHRTQFAEKQAFHANEQPEDELDLTK
jgi:hypothetical protein